MNTIEFSEEEEKNGERREKRKREDMNIYTEYIVDLEH